METPLDLLFKELRRVFVVTTGLAAALFFLAYLLQTGDTFPSVPFFSERVWGIVCLVLSALCGIALPILMRTLYHERVHRKGKVSQANYRLLQLRIVVISLCAAYVAAVAYLFGTSRFHLGASVLAALYGVYGAIPYRKKVRADMKYYGLLEDQNT